MAAVISNSIRFEQKQEDSLTDPLTGLPNTGFLFMYLTRELARAERLKSQLGLLVIHLDDLIGINRTHGHYAGDRALCEVARVLRSAIRPYDVAVRYKGREFIVVLSGCGAGELEQRRLEMKKSVDELYFETAPGKRLKLAIRSGGAIFPERWTDVRSAARDGQQPATASARPDRDLTVSFPALMSVLQSAG